MPCNIQHAPIENIKLGINTVSKAYVGNEQVYPNQRVLTDAVYTDTSTVATGGATRYLRVTGEEGSQYALSGATTGNFSLGPTYTDHAISIGGQSCGASSRTIGNVTLTPIAPTIINGGLTSISRSLTQAAGEAIINWAASLTWTIVNTNRVTVVDNGVTKWASGSSFTIRVQSNSVPTASPPNTGWDRAWYWGASMVYVAANFGSGNVYAWSTNGPTSIDSGTITGTFTSAIPQASFTPTAYIGALGTCTTVNNVNYATFTGPVQYP